MLAFLGLYKPGPADPAAGAEIDDDPLFNVATDEDVPAEDVDG